MESWVVEEYQRWADRGYLKRLSCPHHPWSHLFILVDENGLCWMCGFCQFRHYFSAAEYREIESKIAMAKELFKRG